MKTKEGSVKKTRWLSKAEKVQIDHNVVDQALPVDHLDQVDPFLLVHHWSTILPGGQRSRDLGVAPHPHRGFSPVTLIIQGAIRHRDSRGNDQVVQAGGTQWMHSGMGITHSERPDETLAAEGGALELIQFWVNVPSSSKMKQPSYQPLSKEETPTLTDEEGRFRWSLIAGRYHDRESPIRTESPLLILHYQLLSPGFLQIDVPGGWNCLLYQIGGVTRLNEEFIHPKHMAVLDPDGSSIPLEIIEPGSLLLLAGKPIGEPVERYGPFVMNSQTEILEALRDARIGKMGILIED
jgi:quercetin 2,3-dioxygenase